MTTYDLNTRRGCMHAVVDLRHSARIIINGRKPFQSRLSRARRAVRLVRSGGDAMAERRAAVMDSRLQPYRDADAELRNQLVILGRNLFYIAPFVDQHVPRDLLLDLLNVNPVDRGVLGPGDGLVKIVWAHALDNSAEHRNESWKCSPLFLVAQHYFHEQLASNEALKESTDNMLFGPGGMLEFLPKYQPQPDGTMKRLPPPLRLADPKIDSQRAPASSGEGGGHEAA